MTNAAETPAEREARLKAESLAKVKGTLKKDVAKVNAVATAIGTSGVQQDSRREFNKFLENVQDGWVDWTIDPNDLPYGKPRPVRPKITILTDNTAKDPG